MLDRFGDPIEPTPEPVSDAVWAAEQRRQAIQACTLYGGDGYNGTQVCPHVDFRPAAVRGRQLITQTLQNLRKDHNA